MSITPDPRLTPKSSVHCRTSHVTSVAECKRLFRSNWKAKPINGTVVEAKIDIVNGRRQKSVTVDWKIQERTKRVTLKIVNIKAAKSPVTPEEDRNSQETTSNQESLPQSQTSDAETTPSATSTERDSRGDCPDTIAHDRKWSLKQVSYPLNGPVPRKKLQNDWPGR